MLRSYMSAKDNAGTHEPSQRRAASRAMRFAADAPDAVVVLGLRQRALSMLASSSPRAKLRSAMTRRSPEWSSCSMRRLAVSQRAPSAASSSSSGIII